MATPATGWNTCTLEVNLFSGARAPLPPGTEALLHVRDGSQNAVSLPNNGFFRSSRITIAGLPFFNNARDRYAVVASASGYDQAGFYPVPVNPAALALVDLMLLKKDAGFNFRNAAWRNLKQRYPAYSALLAAGTADDPSAGDRYTQLMETRPDALACCLNLLTSMSQAHLPEKTPLDYLREVIWDDTLQQDRFFAWAEPALIDQVAQAAAQGQFSPEPGTAVFHSGATRSWKQTRFGEANLQLTFHENDRKTFGGVECVMVEPDIDYYKDLGAHALLEVAANKLTGALTDPRQVYVLRWMAGRRAGIPNFEPPYTVE
jgi:hypothetical protein